MLAVQSLLRVRGFRGVKIFDMAEGGMRERIIIDGAADKFLDGGRRD
jgi:hypothetical protein